MLECIRAVLNNLEESNISQNLSTSELPSTRSLISLLKTPIYESVTTTRTKSAVHDSIHAMLLTNDCVDCVRPVSKVTSAS